MSGILLVFILQLPLYGNSSLHFAKASLGQTPLMVIG